MYFEVFMTYWLKFIDEGHFLRTGEERPNKHFYDNESTRRTYSILDDDHFFSLYNTLGWLYKFLGNRGVGSFNSFTRPTREEFTILFNFIELDANKALNGLSTRAFDLRSRPQRSRLQRKLDCVNYYRQLLNRGFFDDKELRTL